MGYDFAAQQLAMDREDPYAAAAQRELSLGRRLPRPYDAAAVHAIQPYDPHRDFHAAFPGHAVVPAASIAGYRQTARGTFGDNAAGNRWMGRNADWDARQRVGYGPLGGRVPGDDLEWDRAESARRYSGRLSSINAFSKYVHQDRPFLKLRATGTGIIASVTAGMNGGSEHFRMFHLGGGATAAFNLAGFDTVKVAIIDREPDAVLDFSFMAAGMQAGDQTLFLAQNVTAGEVTTVPEGAYEVYLEDADTWVWNNPVVGDAPGQTITVSMTANTGHRILGLRYTPTTDNAIVYLLRPI